MRGKIWFPDFTRTHWDVEFERTDRTEVQVVRTHRMLADITVGLRGLDASAERVAWAALWSRAWDIAGGLRGHLASPSLVAASALRRSKGELFLHLHALSNAGVSGTPVVTSPDLHERLRDVLRAYFVWGTANDLQHVLESLKPRNMEGTFDPAPARDQLRQLGENAQAWQEVFGEIEEVSNQEAELDRRRAVTAATARRGELEAQLRTPVVDPWVRRLESLRTSRDRSAKAGERFPSLRTLVWDTDDDSVRRQMRAAATEFGYSVFQRDSQILHGSSVHQFLMSGPDGFGPILRDGDPADREVTRIAESLRLCTLPLMVLREAIVPADA